MNEKIDHENTDEIVCPYCGHEHSDCWEWENDEGKIECDECDKVFNYCRNHSVDYNTSRITCKEGKHKFIFDEPHISYTKYGYLREEKGRCTFTEFILPEEMWTYKEIFTCTECDENEFREITKEEWIKKYPEKHKFYQEVMIKKDKERLPLWSEENK